MGACASLQSEDCVKLEAQIPTDIIMPSSLMVSLKVSLVEATAIDHLAMVNQSGEDTLILGNF